MKEHVKSTDTCSLEADTCKTDVAAYKQMKARVPEIAERIIAHCESQECYTHIDYEPIPSEGFVSDLIDRFREILFPGYFSRERLDPANMKYSLGQGVSLLYDMLSEQIAHHVRHDCQRYDLPCSDCEQSGQAKAIAVLEAIPEIRRMLATDVQATFDGDPAAKSHDEIIFSYPGIFAVMVHRVAHRLFELEVPLLPRIMNEHAHSVTGIDIHPGAIIGPRFVIDHGTGVVIGETTHIGKNVRIYQGVTLGALSLPKNAGEQYRGKRRHPTIEDDVIIYSGATILGGDTVIGARSVIGGNVWLTESVPADMTVMMEHPRLVYKSAEKNTKGV
ncbi:MAG: serine acetyltransferase [Desulfatitalea sp. BRH_c12]|nr:MAG: serine acetyltransferase [Desulfatitalea sp. BRH_c12]